MPVADPHSLLSPELLERARKEAETLARAGADADVNWTVDNGSLQTAADEPAPNYRTDNSDLPVDFESNHPSDEPDAAAGESESSPIVPEAAPSATKSDNTADVAEVIRQQDTPQHDASPIEEASSNALIDAAEFPSDNGDSGAEIPADQTAQPAANPLLDDEVAAELSKLESMPPEALEDIPSLDDGTDDLAAALQEIEQMQNSSEPEGSDDLSGALAEAEAALAADGEAVTATDRPLRLKLGEKTIQPSGPAAGPSIDAPEPRRLRGLARFFYRLVDDGLELINAPLQWLPAGTRGILGGFAVVTIVISVAAMTLRPILLPRIDPKTFVERKRVELERLQREAEPRRRAFESIPSRMDEIPEAADESAAKTNAEASNESDAADASDS